MAIAKIGGGAIKRRAATQSFTATPTAPPVSLVRKRTTVPPLPKPPPVIVPNRTGSFSRPKPPPPVAPGPIQSINSAKPRTNIAGVGGIRPPNAPQQVAPVEAPPVEAQLNTPEAPPGLEQYLSGDTDYLGAQGNARSELARFLAGHNTTRSNNSNSFAQRLRDLQTSQQGDESDLQEDFASRGLARSGSYAEALSGLQQQYLGSTTNLQGEQAGAESDLAAQLADFQAQQQLAMQEAQAEAIARRAAQYGLG